eukprot:9033747-Ditylum_brightwellii.AAC.1
MPWQKPNATRSVLPSKTSRCSTVRSGSKSPMKTHHHNSTGFGVMIAPTSPYSYGTGLPSFNVAWSSAVAIA